MFLLLILSALQTANATTLEQSYSEALRKNETLEQSRNKIDQADSRYSQMKGAVMPNVALLGTYFVQPALKDPIAREIFPNQQTTVSLSVTQPIFRGLREFAGLSQQKTLLAASKDNYLSSQVQLYQNVAQSFFNILALEQDLKNLKQQADIYSSRVGELQGRVKRGESSASESLTAQTSELNIRSDLENTNSLLATERENFTYLTGLPQNTAVTDPQLKPTLDKLDVYLGSVNQRPDVMAAEKRMNASDKDVSIARGAHYPSIDVVGNYYLTRPPGFLNEINWDLQFKITFPIFEGGATQAKVNEAASRMKDSELEFHRIQRQAEQEIRSIYQSLQTRLAQLDVLKRASDIAQKNTEVLQKEYRRGLSRNIDVQVALADYRVTRRAYDQTYFSTQYDWIRLQAASAKLQLPKGSAE
ncbi:MAG: TolC family protein [Bdellovibrionales bacterium]|nr:TolC family protein [Bdellovibrionales bacterium]